MATAGSTRSQADGRPVGAPTSWGERRVCEARMQRAGGVIHWISFLHVRQSATSRSSRRAVPLVFYPLSGAVARRATGATTLRMSCITRQNRLGSRQSRPELLQEVPRNHSMQLLRVLHFFARGSATSQIARARQRDSSEPHTANPLSRRRWGCTQRATRVAGTAAGQRAAATAAAAPRGSARQPEPGAERRCSRVGRDVSQPAASPPCRC